MGKNQDLPLPLIDFFERLEQHTGIAWILDVRIGSFNDIVEERLQLGIPKMTCRCVQRLRTFLKELADVVSRQRDNFTFSKSLLKAFQELSITSDSASSNTLTEFHGFTRG